MIISIMCILCRKSNLWIWMLCKAKLAVDTNENGNGTSHWSCSLVTHSDTRIDLRLSVFLSFLSDRVIIIACKGIDKICFWTNVNEQNKFHNVALIYIFDFTLQWKHHNQDSWFELEKWFKTLFAIYNYQIRGTFTQSIRV